MVQGTQWPSFIIQGMILGSDIYLISNANVAKTWIFLSILFILSLFALQATTIRFIYLFPVNKNTGDSLVYLDTHLLRLFIILSALFLYLGILQKYSVLSELWFVLVGLFFILIHPGFPDKQPLKR